MSTKLEKFIQMHKQELSSLTPPESLWLSIGAVLPKTTVIASKVSWLKIFGFSASTIAVATALTITLMKQNDNALAGKPAQSVNPPVLTSGPSPSQQDQPEISALHVLMNEPVKDTPKTLKREPVAPLPPAMPVTPVAPAAPVHAVPVAPGVPAVPAAQPAVPTAPVFSAPKALEHGTSISWTQKENGGLKADTSFAGVKKVELYVSSCDVFINRSAIDKTGFKADITTESRGIVTGGKDEYELLYRLDDSVLSITLQNKCKKRVVVGTYIENAVINLDIPDQVSLYVKNSYGMVNAKGLVGKEYDFETASGDIMAEDIHGSLKFRSGYGMVSAKNIQGDVRANVASGDLFVEKLTGNAEVSSSYGQQVYKNITGRLKIIATSGDVQITSMKGDTEIKSNYGNITLSGYEGMPTLEAVSGDITGKDVRLKGNMTVKSNYGSIRMNLLNESNELSFDLSTSYGQINVSKGDSKGESDTNLRIRQGDILITGITTSGDQTYK